MIKTIVHLSVLLLTAPIIACEAYSSLDAAVSAISQGKEVKSVRYARWLTDNIVTDSTTGSNTTATDEGGDHADEQAEIIPQDGPKPWGAVIGSTLLVNSASLVGVITFIPLTRCVNKRLSEKIVEIVISSSAAGALIATTSLLIFPEAAVLLEKETDEHAHEGEQEENHEVSWKFGVAVLAGFLLPLALSALFPRPEDHKCDETCMALNPAGAAQDETDAKSLVSCSSCAEAALSQAPDAKAVSHHDHCYHHHVENTDADIISHDNFHHHHVENDDEENRGAKTSSDGGSVSDDRSDGNKASVSHVPDEIRRRIDWPLCCSILIGDGFHNFADGIFIGTAFAVCNSSVAITIMAISVYHEIAQELADFFILTNHGGLTTTVALALNFLSGMTVMLGGIIGVAVNLSNQTIGVILGLAGGVYIQIAACECLPRVFQLYETKRDRFASILAFIFGTIPIGLVLLNHKHCGL